MTLYRFKSAAASARDLRAGCRRPGRFGQVDLRVMIWRCQAGSVPGVTSQCCQDRAISPVRLGRAAWRLSTLTW